MTVLARRTAGSLVAALLLGASLAACGSSASKPTTSTMSVSAATAAIRTAFTTLFNLSNPSVSVKLGVVQDGAQLRQAITDELKSPLAKLAGGASLQSVKIEHGTACRNADLTSPCAAVTYSILSTSQTPLLRNSKGFALYVGSRWLVSKTTICTLLTLANGNVPPKGC